MFSISRVMCSSVKCLYGNSLPRANYFVSKLILVNSESYKILTKSPTYRRVQQPRHYGTMSLIKIYKTEDKFYIEMDKTVAELKFGIENGIMEIKHTKVPKKLGGHGLGKLLAKAALEYAVRNDLVLKISCSFVDHYVSEYEPHYLKYVLH